MEPGAIAFNDMVRELTKMPPGMSYETFLCIKRELRAEEEMGFDSADERAEVLADIARDYEVSPGAVAWIYYSGV